MKPDTLIGKFTLRLITGCCLTVLSLTFITCCNIENPIDEDPTTCDTCDNFQDAFVIGFDQCAASSELGMSAGYLIAVPVKGDTMMTYNFPDSLYQFPKEYFAYAIFRALFPDSARYDFPVRIKYRFALEEEMISIVCPGYIVHHTGMFKFIENQIVILDVTK